MSWRDGLGKGKYKTGARKKKSKAPGVVLAVVVLGAVAFSLFHFDVVSLPFGQGDGLIAAENGSPALPGNQSVGDAMSIVDIVELVSDSVVEISVVTGDMRGAGSGVIISEDGYIVTNDHVVSGASSIAVRLFNGDSFEASLVGSSPENDLAVIKIEAANLSPAVMGVLGNLRTGESVVAIGNPLGTFGGTVTDGIISALEREVVLDGVSMTLLQTNAAVNPGNSGGGLFNMSGELIGIIVAKDIEAEGIGFAIPIDVVSVVLTELISN
jgi:serine protease Do